MQTAFFYAGTHRLSYQRSRRLPSVSILVALRNEENSVADCISSLLRQQYPADKLEILLIDDRSSDRTGTIIRSFAQDSPLLRTMHIQHSIKGLSGKANAVAQGIPNCQGEIILVTDGDCRVPQSWVKTHVSYYTAQVGMVGGFTLLDEPDDKTGFWGKLQSLDWAYLLSVGSGAIGFGLPLSILGNNFSFRRRAYEEVGGYRNMGFTIIEDFALMKALIRQTDWKVRYPINRDMLVTSNPMPSIRAFIGQRKRWAAGGKEVGFYGKFLMFISVLLHCLVPVSFIQMSFGPAVLAAAILFAADFILLWRTTGMVRRRDLLRYFCVWELFYFLYTILFTPALLFPTTVTWKGVTYKWHINWQLKKMFEHSGG